jgi:hypothetical protein
MATSVVASSGQMSRWTTGLIRLLTGALVGGLLGVAYGVLVGGVHFATSGRWDRGTAFLLGSAAAGATLGLAAGCLLALFSRKTASTGSALPLVQFPALKESSQLAYSPITSLKNTDRALAAYSRNSSAPSTATTPVHKPAHTPPQTKEMNQLPPSNS